MVAARESPDLLKKLLPGDRGLGLAEKYLDHRTATPVESGSRSHRDERLSEPRRQW